MPRLQTPNGRPDAAPSNPKRNDSSFRSSTYHGWVGLQTANVSEKQLTLAQQQSQDLLAQLKVNSIAPNPSLPTRPSPIQAWLQLFSIGQASAHAVDLLRQSEHNNNNNDAVDLLPQSEQSRRLELQSELQRLAQSQRKLESESDDAARLQEQLGRAQEQVTA